MTIDTGVAGRLRVVERNSAEDDRADVRVSPPLEAFACRTIWSAIASACAVVIEPPRAKQMDERVCLLPLLGEDAEVVVERKLFHLARLDTLIASSGERT